MLIGMLSRSPVHVPCSLASTASLHYFDPTSSFLGDQETTTLQRSSLTPSRFRTDSRNLYRTASSSFLSRSPSLSVSSAFLGPASPRHGYLAPNTELDACWRGSSSSRQSMPSPDWHLQNNRQPTNGHTDFGPDLYTFLKEAQLDHYYSVFSKHLKIRTVQQIKYVTDADLDELGMSKPEQRRLKRYFEKECPQTAMGKLKKKLSRSTSTRSVSVGRGTGRFDPASGGGGGHRPTSPEGYRIIPASELDVATPLGQGEFGRVHQGLWRSATGRELQVAVKVLDLDKFPAAAEDFLKEAALMHSLDHPNIVRFHGVCVSPNSLKLVTELAPLRSLLECLREPDLYTKFPVSILHNFAVQIARGMAYLEEERLVHRDLAARNVLVFSTEEVKIGDFGLSRALQLGKSYYQTNFSTNLRLPVAWCAPESIHDLCFTSASDVWSYGVTLWEIFTFGLTPWAGLSGRQILETIDSPVCRRLEQPNACPDAVYDAVMRACWNHDPISRPTFAQLVEMLPRLSPQAWNVIADCDGDGEPPLRTTDIHSLLNATQPVGVEEDEEADNEQKQNLEDRSAIALRKPRLSVHSREMVYVLSKKDPELWKVFCHNTGRIGYVPSNNLHICPVEETSVSGSPRTPKTHSQSGTLSRMRLRLSRREFSNRSGRSSTRPVRLCADLISLPQNDFRHVGHVGADGTIFGDLGLVSRAFSDLERGQSPTDSCLTLESNSDKENPRLSDITLSESHHGGPFNHESSTTGKFSSCDTDRDGWMETSKWSSRPPTDKTSPLSSPMENKLFPRSAVGDPVAKTIRPPSPPASSGALEGGGEEPSLFDMGSSFMDEVFKCFSLSVSDTVDTSLQSAPINTKPSCHAEVTQPERIPVYDDVVPTVESTSSVSNTSPRMQSSSPPAPAILAPLTRDSPIQRTCLKKTDVTSMAPAEISPSSPSISSRASPPSASHCAPPQGFVSNTLTRALRKTSLRNTSLTRRGRVSSAVSLEQQPEEGVANISPPVSGRSSASRKSKRSLEKSAPAKPQKPIISGPIVISGPVVLDNGTIVANPTHLLGARPLQRSAEESSSHGSISQGSSLTVISVPSSSSSGIPPTLSNSQHQKRSSPWVDDSKSVTSSERSVGGHLQPGHQPASSISTTPSISPAPSLSSMGSSLAAAAGPSLRPMTGGTGASSGIRALRDKDAVFRATTATCSNLPASRRRVFHSQALPPPSELLNSRGRLSVSDAAPHFSLAVGTSATGFRASRMDTVSMDAATSRRALTSETGDTASPVSPSSSSLLMDSGIMAAATSSPLAEVTIHSTNTDSDHRRPHAVCEDASTRGTADLSFWGPDLVGFLCGSGSLAANECSQGISSMKPLLAPLDRLPNDDDGAVAL